MRPAAGPAALLVALAALAILGPAAGAAGAPTPAPGATPGPGIAWGWRPTGTMAFARIGHTATLLRDGTVLAVGGGAYDGRDLSREFPPITAAERYDPATGTWRPAGELAVPRRGHTATLLADGTVLVAGGHGGEDPGPLATAERYDPATDTWTRTGDLRTARAQHTATLLPDGSVLIAGGSGANPAGLTELPLASAERYDPATGAWNPAGNLATARWGHTATPVADGRVLVAGGAEGETENGWPVFLASAEVYDPATGAWEPTGDLITAREAHVAAALPDGSVLVTGGEDWHVPVDETPAELYDPATGTWRLTDRTRIPNRDYHAAATLADGTVLLVGGQVAPELYYPRTGTWVLTRDLGIERELTTVTALADGTALVAGGQGDGVSQATAERYVPLV